jgi:hypothetical protein
MTMASRLTKNSLSAQMRRAVITSKNRNVASAAKKPKPILKNQPQMLKFGALGIGFGAAQYKLGSSDSFFEHKFITQKHPDDLATFYGTEGEFLFVSLKFTANLEKLLNASSSPIYRFHGDFLRHTTNGGPDDAQCNI